MKKSQNIATNLLTYEASSFAYVNTVDLFCISIPDLLETHLSLSLFFHQTLFDFIFSNNFVCKQLSSMLLNSYRSQQRYGFS